MIGLLNANALDIPLADQSVQMVATSPPYYGLRDYGTGKWEGGDPECDHNPQRPDGGERADRTLPLGRGGMYRDICAKCGAIRIDNQLGLEPTPEAYVANLVAVFREIRRVLRDDGVVFLNLGDSYNGSGGAGGDYNEGGLKEGQPRYPGRNIDYLKPKDLIGIPWRVAFALQADGWWLRSDIIWSKPNPMPESVTDRPTKAHEYIFLLTKSARYFWDQEAVREPYEPTGGTFKSGGTPIKNYRANGNHLIEQGHLNPSGRNIRTVWHIATAPYKGAHFATWPPKLVEPMIKAGSRPGDTILDPFAGSGTTLMVARQLGRSAIGLDLSFAYLKENATKRLELDKWKAWTCA